MADDQHPTDGGAGGSGERFGPTGRSQGSVRVQSAETSRPRPPTAAETRQREKARRAREAAEELAAAQEAERLRRASQRRKVLMGSVAVAGIAGVIGLSYMGHDREVSATCVKDGSDEVVPDEYCSGGTSRGGGIFIFAGSPYRYYYGGTNGGYGTVARGGTLELPKNTVGRTSAGSTISRKGSGVSITRGGFGSSSHSSVGS